jgi:peptidoglycan L-alanyl-D-glutamate endopeptidase CwlK
MTRNDLRARDLTRLTGIHPECRGRVLRVLMAMDALGHTMTITDGVRTADEQARLYAQGRTAPGAIVTNADGYTTRSNHQPKADGLGRAVDCCFVDDAFQPTWEGPWAAYGACAEAVGLVWGGSWKSIQDKPHVEWPA